jgi:Ca-activated chloride channel family protein
MSFNPLRRVLAAVLMAVFVFSLLPVSYAGSPTSATEQSSSSDRPRRGKNGQAITSDAAKQDAKPKKLEPVPQSQSQPRSQPKPQSPPPATQAPSNDRRSAAGEAPVITNRDNDPLSGEAQESGGIQRRPEPPAFDRPPIGQDRSSQTGTATSDSRPSTRPTLGRPPASDSRTPSRQQPRVDSRDQSPSSQSSGADSSASDVDDERQDRSSRQRPTLNRPTDVQPQSPRPRQEDNTENRSNTGQQPRVNPPEGNPSQGPDDGEVIKLESTLVNIPMLVSDRSGRYIPQLSARDFTLYEDGVQQEIASFGSEEVPFNVAMLLDVSPSVQNNIPDIQDAALAFIRQLRSQDRVMVISFDRGVHYLTEFTSNRRELENAIRSLSTGSGTSVYEAVYETVRRKMRNVDGRKALILFSDGEDTTSGSAGYDDAINIVTESDVLVYGLRYPGGNGGGNIRVDPWPRNRIPQIPFPFPFPWPRRRGPFTNLTQDGYTMNAAPPAAPQSWPRRRGGGGGDFMTDITTAGGGPVYDAEKIGDLSRLASRIADELRHVYVVSYYPTNALSNGGYRAIRIRVKNRDDIAVRHRRGYNARDAGGNVSH